LEKKAFTEVPHHSMPSTVPQSIVPTTSESEGMATVMLIMLELLDLCGDSAPSLLMVQLEVDSLGTSAVASMSPSLEQMLVSVESLASLQELCDLLISLEITYPRCGKIVFLLSRKDTVDKIRRV
jgi:hypothetical protein